MIGVALDNFQNVALDLVGEGQFEVKRINSACDLVAFQNHSNAGALLRHPISDFPGQIAGEAVLFEFVRLAIVSVGAVWQIAADRKQNRNSTPDAQLWVGKPLSVHVEDVPTLYRPAGDDPTPLWNDLQHRLSCRVGEQVGFVLLLLD